MIKRRYLAQKLEEQDETGTFHERRAYKPFWRTRIGSTYKWRHGGDAVFLCGKYAFHADIINITLDQTPPGIGDVVGGSLCYNVECKFRQSELEGLSLFLAEVV